LDICFPICSAARARASLGIAFASLLDLLLIFIGFGIDRKVIQKQNIRGPPKTSSRLGGGFPRQGKGGVKPRSEVRKKGRKEERQKERQEDGRKGG
jgi:hypothetical protein